MGFQVQPRNIDVPASNPFANDKLGRKEPAEILTGLVYSFDGPCVIAIDAAWGRGKTTFLQMWTQHLRNEGCPVVAFNAWETDFSNLPLLALTDELIEEIDSLRSSNAKLLEDFKTTARKVLPRAGIELVQGVAASFAGPAAGSWTGKLLECIVEEQLSEYGRVKKAIVEFRTAIQDVAFELGDNDDTRRPLVIVIDELDRCRPTYAIELLEIAKHLFSVDGVVFALGINRGELEHSVRAVYGADFDGAEYLRRFFDIDFQLPEPDRHKFIDAQLSELEIDRYFESGQQDVQSGGENVARKLLMDFFGSADLDLRTVGQSLHRLGLVLATLPSDSETWTLTATFVLILRTVDSNLYYRFARGEVTDEAVAKAMFALRPDDYRYTDAGRNLEFQILRAGVEAQLERGLEWNDIESPLLLKYRELAGENTEGGVEKNAETNHAIAVIRWTQHDQERWWHGGAPPMFRNSYERLELVSGDLLPTEQRPNQ